MGDKADVNVHRPVRREGLQGLVDAVRLAALAALAEAILPTGGREASRGVVERPRPDQPSRDSPQELSFFRSYFKTAIRNDLYRETRHTRK